MLLIFVKISCVYQNSLDAPCSGSGMFKKDDKMIEDWHINKVLVPQNFKKS